MSRAEVLKLGRYVLHSEIAAGGMAAVHFGRLAGAGGFQKTVAIKRLHPQFARDPDFRNMILEEARLAARIRHPNVVQPLDVVADQGELLLVMEYVHGESLSRILRAARQAGEAVPLAIAAAVMANVLHGLHAAHEARDDRGRALDIVHRDVSPQNVIVGVDGVARVIDFGIAKAATSHETTRAGTVKGKVPYLAPEQLSGEVATRLTDIYAAGVVFWEMLAGRKLFEADNDQAVVQQILKMPVPSPSSLHREVTEAVDDIVLTAIARDPRDRFDSAREMALALEELVQLATPTVVGQWVEAHVSEQIAWRADQLSLVDALPQQSAPPSGAPPRSAKPSVPPPPAMPETVKMSGEFRRSLPGPPPPASPRVAPAPARAVASPAPAPRLPAAGELRKPSVEIPNVAWLPTPEGRYEPVSRKKSRSVTPFVVAVLLLGFVGFFFALPQLVRRGYEKEAARHGITLQIGAVDLGRSLLTLRDVRVESRDLPGLTGRAQSVDVRHAWLTPHAIVIRDGELVASGTWAEVSTRLDRLRTERRELADGILARRHPIQLESGRVRWDGALGPGANVSLENVTFELKPNEIPGGKPELRLRAPIAKLVVNGVAAGPWDLEHHDTGLTARTQLRFDPTGTNDAHATWTSAPDGAASLELRVPPSSLAELRLPDAILSGHATAGTRLEAHGKIEIVSEQVVGRPPARVLTGAVAGFVSSLSAAKGWPLLDARLELAVSGDATAPSPVKTGGVWLGASQAGLVPGAAGWAPIMAGGPAGTIDLSGHGGSALLAARTTSRPCAIGKGETALVVRLELPLAALGSGRFALEPTGPCPPRVR